MKIDGFIDCDLDIPCEFGKKSITGTLIHKILNYMKKIDQK